MVCLSDAETIKATVRDTIGASLTKSVVLHLYPGKAVKTVFTEVSNAFNYDVEAMELVVQHFPSGDLVVLNENKEKTLIEAGVVFNADTRTTIMLNQLKNKNMTLYVQNAGGHASTATGSSYEDDLLLGASASPTTGEAPSQDPAPTKTHKSIDSYYNSIEASKDAGGGGVASGSNRRHSLDSVCNYVGLVNQAMTCYLNSLLQALYMTPEFRNALYNWEFDGSNPKSSIPFQLQKLFLNLQTSAKSAVETTDLTHSFGWDMQAAWEQHDIQELCRVMFDALETKFKDTTQSNLINNLYEGKMLDYVKCLECSTEKSREDTFQDIPLPVRPFGSTVAYNSVEEALRAFVQPETLDGNNQYYCEKCNKKCDAHKGLKFTKFPYLLTLHLKRFDFDYSTMNRIKLNDKVVFPEMLNLNSFLLNPKVLSSPNSDEVEHETVVKCDDCSTTDSGSALDDDTGGGGVGGVCASGGAEVATTLVGGGASNDDNQDDDEGIDVSSGGNNHNENDKNELQELKGPYLYELFSIMIHSGSASGGHYYAYIKDFTKNQWFCFNDQNVTRVTEDDIYKTYGGGPQRGYYSGAYTSSTNAYMLMYRQIDQVRNCESITLESFPTHISQLLQDMREQEEKDRIKKEKDNDTYKIKIFCCKPGDSQLSDGKLFIFVDSTLDEVTLDAFEKFKLKDSVVKVEDCRLVSYSRNLETIECSFPDMTITFGQIANKFTDFLLEIKKPEAQFEDLKMGGVNMKVYLINLESEEVDGPTNIRVNAGETVKELKLRLRALFGLVDVQIVQETYSNQPHYLEDESALVKFDARCNGYKLYVSNAVDLEDPEKPFIVSKLASVIDRFVHIIMLDIALPATDSVTLEQLSIPALDMNHNVDKIEVGGGDRGVASNSPSLRVSPQPQSNEMFAGDQSNSEDSSLSDSDRTLVGDAPGDNLGQLSSNSNSPSEQQPQQLASVNLNESYYTYTKETDDTTTTFKQPQKHEEMQWEDPDLLSEQAASQSTTIPIVTRCSPFYYFKAQDSSELSSPDNKCVRVLVDKRMNLAKLKKHIEPYVGVPMEYFKVYRQYPNQVVEWSLLNDTLSSTKDGERLIVKLGRVLKSNEYSGTIYHLTPNGAEPFVFLFEWIIAKDALVADVKRDVIVQAKKQLGMSLDYNRVRLRKKNWKNPSKIYLETQRFADCILINHNFEIFVQDLGCDGEPAHVGDLVLFVKRWSPGKLSLGPFQEVILEGNRATLEELKKRVADVSGDIPVECVEVALSKSSFPCDTNVLDIDVTLDWNPDVVQLESYPLQVYDDGSVFFYRDSRETIKQLTSDEKKELNQSENKRLGRFNAKSPYSPRRERGLKIYVDTSPKIEDEVFLD